MMLAQPSVNARVHGTNQVVKPTIIAGASERTVGLVKKATVPKQTEFQLSGRKRVYVPDSVHVFVPAEIVQHDGKGKALVQVRYPTSWSSTTVVSKHKPNNNKKSCPALEHNSEQWVATSDLHYQNDSGSHDMQNLVHLTSATMLYNLKERHAKSQPYTDCLQVLVAMNPFTRPPDLYSCATQKLYADSLVWNRSQRKRPPPPHVYQVSSAAYHALMQPSRRNQTILVSGESGAGKSETVKLVLHHLAMMEHSRLEDSNPPTCHTVQRILEASPILEAFGNAKTLRNDNSSRFGKFTELQFDVGDIPRLSGSKFHTYLLEKSRAIGHNPGERSYHIFYQMLSSSEELRQQIWPDQQLPTFDSFCYLSGNDHVVGCSPGDSSSWERTCTALETFDITIGDGSLVELLRALAIVLQLGNLQVTGEDQAAIGARRELDILSLLVGIDSSELETALTVRIMKTAFDEVMVPLRPSVAKDGCDALAKEVYARIFNRLVSRINSLTESHDNVHGTISILDIFGFEKFAVNRFEQLCINYANERLQHQYINSFCVIPEELKGLGTDRFDMSQIDNSRILDLLDGKDGLLDALNEECITPNGSDEGYVQRIKRAHGRRKAFVDERLHRRTEFGVNHFAEPVVYEATNFLDRNNDTLPSGLMECISKSNNVVLKEEFEAMMAERKAAQEHGRKTKKVHTTVIQKFRTQLKHLLDSMEGTDTRFIRCIKPNESMTPRMTDQFSTLRQLKCAGLVAAIDVARYRDLQVGGLIKAKSAVRIQTQFRKRRAVKQVRTLRRSRAAVVVQAHMRRFLVVKTLLLIRRERAARKIQNLIRKAQAVARVHAMRLHRLAIRVQSRIRACRAREVFLAKRQLRSAIRIQACMRRYRAMRVSRDLRHQMLAATRIQSHVRRRKWSKVFKALKRCKAATVIQSKVRQRNASMFVAEMRRIRAAVVAIQSLIRGKRARKTVEEMKRLCATLTIQTSFRRYRAMCRVAGMRRIRAATAIQTSFRCYSAVRHMTRWRNAATRIQSYARRMSAAAAVVVRRRTAASVRIQQRFRQRMAVRVFDQLRLKYSAALLLQRQIRMYLAKKWVEVIQFHRAASIIQASARRRKLQKELAATVIQRRWIAHVKEQQLRLLLAAILVQSLVRMKAARKVLKRMRQCRAATILQRHFRAFLAPKHAAANAIRRCWRLYTIRQRIRISNAATLIQAVARMYLVHLIQLPILRQDRAARIIQVQVRHRLAVRHGAAIILQRQSRHCLTVKHNAARVIQSHWFAFYFSIASTTSIDGYSDSFLDLEDAITLLDQHSPVVEAFPLAVDDGAILERTDSYSEIARGKPKKRWFGAFFNSCYTVHNDDVVTTYESPASPQSGVRGEHRASF